jgi:acyl carrier protein
VQAIGDLEVAIRDFILASYQRERADGLTNSDHLVELGILDSINVIRLVDFLEETYGIELVPDDLFEMTTITNISRIVQRKVAG